MNGKIVVFGTVLVLMLLVAILCGSASASESTSTLDIYGNANEDTTIDMRDVTFTERIIRGLNAPTRLADANNDGKINMLDVTQTELIILEREKELTLIDTANRTVTVKKPLERIVVFTSDILEPMRSINATDKVVGVDKHAVQNDVFFPEFVEYPVVGSTWSPDYEAVLALNPDAVFTYASYGEEIPDKLKELAPSISVVCLDCFSSEIYAEEVTKLGYILEKREEAKEFLDFYEGFMNTIEERVRAIPEEERPRVYYEAWADYNAAGTGPGRHVELVAAGGKNIFSDLSDIVEIDPEELVKRDPEVITRGTWINGFETDDLTELSAIRDGIMNRPGLAGVTAVKNGKVYVIAEGIPSGASFFVRIGNYAKWFYPELFEDFDTRVYLQEYLTRFQGLDFDVSEQGVFVYPEA